MSDVTSSSCSCPPGVTGVNCETTDYCFNVDCNGRGRCESDVTTATHTCHCVEGWQGSDCGMQVCLEGTCMNGGVCAFDGCRCESGWSGPTCEERLPLACLGVECAHGSWGEMLADGKLVLIAEFDDDILVLRYSANGELDTTFATQGFSRIDIAGREDEVYDAALTADGHILVAGQTDNPISATAGDPYIIQLTPQGDLDTSFGTNGVSIVSSPGTDIVNNRFNAMSVTQDGKIVAAGAVRNSFSFSVGDDILIARFLADGTPDSSFADNGVFIHDTNTNLEELLAVTVNTAGEVFATGERSNDLILLKLLEDGTLDHNFGDQGTVFVDVPDEQDNKQSNSGDAIFVQSNNTILVVGSFGSTANAGRLMVMMNFSSNGTLAASFGDGGTFPVDFDPQNNLSEGVGAASQDSEGRIIVSTNASTEEISESNIRISRFFVD